MSLPITISEPIITQPKLWRFTGSVSSIVGFSCYALSPSFKDLFGKWNPFKISIYTILTLLIFLLMLFVNKWKGIARTFLLKAHVGFLVLMLTSLYSFYEDPSEETNKEKAYGSILSLISCGAFALMSMSLARQLELGFEVGMLNFFIGCFLVTVMKMNFKSAPVAAIFCYLLVNFGSWSNCLLKILGREREHADVECGLILEAEEDPLDTAKDDNLSLGDGDPVKIPLLNDVYRETPPRNDVLIKFLEDEIQQIREKAKYDEIDDEFVKRIIDGYQKALFLFEYHRQEQQKVPHRKHGRREKKFFGKDG